MSEERIVTPEPDARAGGEDAAGEGVVVPRRRSKEREPDAGMSPWARRGLVLGLSVAAAAIVGLVFAGVQGGTVYSKPVDELVRNRARYAGRPVRAEGNLVHGSLVKRDKPCEYRFTIEKAGVEVPVRYAQCVVPDTFRDVPGMDVAVTVEGEIRPDNSFEATQVLAKCPSKYEMKEKQKNGEQMPHGPTGGSPNLN